MDVDDGEGGGDAELAEHGDGDDHEGEGGGDEGDREETQSAAGHEPAEGTLPPDVGDEKASQEARRDLYGAAGGEDISCPLFQAQD